MSESRRSELTPDARQFLDNIRWLRADLATEPADRREARAAIVCAEVRQISPSIANQLEVYLRGGGLVH